MYLILAPLFLLWAILLPILAFVAPKTFLQLKKYIPHLLGLITFGIGMTLNTHYFKSITDIRAPFSADGSPNL